MHETSIHAEIWGECWAGAQHHSVFAWVVVRFRVGLNGSMRLGCGHDGVPVLCCAEYNSVRLIFTVLIALFFGTAFWNMGMRRRDSLWPPCN